MTFSIVVTELQQDKVTLRFGKSCLMPPYSVHMISRNVVKPFAFRSYQDFLSAASSLHHSSSITHLPPRAVLPSQSSPFLSAECLVLFNLSCLRTFASIHRVHVSCVYNRVSTYIPFRPDLLLQHHNVFS